MPIDAADTRRPTHAALFIKRRAIPSPVAINCLFVRSGGDDKAGGWRDYGMRKWRRHAAISRNSLSLAGDIAQVEFARMRREIIDISSAL